MLSRPPGPALCALLTAMLVMPSMTGCGDDLLPGDVPKPPIVWEGDHVRVGTDLDLDEWCGGSLPRLDAYAGAVMDLFDDHGVVTYYLFEPPVSELGVCPPRGAACAISIDDEGVVLTDELPDDHEVVHVVGHTGTIETMPHFFEEGGASYWGGQRGRPDARGVDVRELIDTHWEGGMNGREYAAAAHFTSHLVDTYGVDSYVKLRNASFWLQSRGEFERTFLQVIGAPLDEALDDYEERPYCPFEATRSSFYECAGDVDYYIAAGAEVLVDVDVSCSNSQVIGPAKLGTEPDRIWRDLVVEIEDSSNYVVFEEPELGEANSVAVQIKRCATECFEVWTNTKTLLPRGTPQEPDFFVFDLLPGRYVVRVSRDVGDPGRVRFRWL